MAADSPPSSATRSDDTATVMAVGALAATVAAVCHETLGHGLGCLAVGGQIELLTSIWFRCAGGSAITDAGGPAGNLAAGTAALMLLNYKRLHATVKLFLLMCAALNLLWFAGQLAFGSITDTDDWHYTALQLGWPPVWRPIGAVVGIGSYVALLRWVSAVIRARGGTHVHAIRLAYIAGAGSAVVAGLMWQPDPLASGFQGLLALGVAPLGLLTAAKKAHQDAPHDPVDGSVPRSWTWILLSTVFFGLFLFVQAAGLGSIAASGLAP